MDHYGMLKVMRDSIRAVAREKLRLIQAAEHA
jgi:hypothetical protein